MTIFNSSLAPYFPSFFLSQLRKSTKCFIHRFPLDVFVDDVFCYLHVEDILCLRRVNKAFYILTHSPVIWKRFLSQLTAPIPPIRPTFRYALNATDFEVEQLVTRAISLEDNWRQPSPKIVCSQVIIAHYTVLDLRLLPGGKYLVASVKDSNSFRFYIVVFCLDHPSGPRALARFPIKAKAFSLQAKYVRFKDKYVIMIAYVCRGFTTGAPLNLDPNQYSGDCIEPPHPMFNEVVCVRISMDSLEALSDPRILQGSLEYQELAGIQDGPFFQVMNYASKYELDLLSLYESHGMPHASFVEDLGVVVMINLVTAKVKKLERHHPLDEAFSHRIRAVRHLPHQNEVIIIHTAAFNKTQHVNTLELYDEPQRQGTTRLGCKAVFELLSEVCVGDFHISDYGIPRRNEDNYRLQRDYHAPPPISIYAETLYPNMGIKHFVLWPSCKIIPGLTPEHGPRKLCYYSLEHVVPQTTHHSGAYRPHVLPGAFRAIMYTVNRDDRTATPSLVNLRRYVNPEYQDSDYPIPRLHKSSHVMRKNHPPLPLNMYCSVDLGSDMQARYAEDGMAAITWDEGIGRVCMASGDSDVIDILDFAYVVQPGQRFRQWMRCQEFIYGRRT